MMSVAGAVKSIDSAGPESEMITVGSTTSGTIDETGNVDTMDIFDNDAVANDVGTLTSSNLSGLGMGGDQNIGGTLWAGGITYANQEIIEIRWGSGSETLGITSIAANAITLVRVNLIRK